MPEEDAQTDSTYEFQHMVQALDSAASLHLQAGDEFPDVLATSRMVALMELAAARLMRRLLGPGQLSVGVSVDVRHLAATRLFETVTVKAIDLGTEGKLQKFRVEVTDVGGLVGEGSHTRAIIMPGRLLEGAAKRIEAARSR